MKYKEATNIFLAKSPKYFCEKHGEVGEVITSNIKDFEGAWCQRCFLESLGKPLKEMNK